MKKILDSYEELKVQNEYMSTMVKQLEADAGKAQEEKTSMNIKITKNADNEKIKDEQIQELSKLISEKDVAVQTLQELETAVSTTNKELESLNKDLLKKINELENQINRHKDYQQSRKQNAALSAQKNNHNEKAEFAKSVETLQTQHQSRTVCYQQRTKLNWKIVDGIETETSKFRAAIESS
jgi:septal ring factor EnvC (AmiA/AmiB activator)